MAFWTLGAAVLFSALASFLDPTIHRTVWMSQCAGNKSSFKWHWDSVLDFTHGIFFFMNMEAALFNGTNCKSRVWTDESWVQTQMLFLSLSGSMTLTYFTSKALFTKAGMSKILLCCSHDGGILNSKVQSNNPLQLKLL